MVVLIVVVFFLNGQFQIFALPDAPSRAACEAAGPVMKAKAEAADGVRVAKWSCLAVDPTGNAS